MHVATDTVRLAAHDERRLGVRLELDQAVHDPDARLLELLGPLDVSLFVEPGLQLDKDEYFFAASSRAQQRFDDFRAPAGAIQRQFDRHDIRIVRRFGHQSLHRRLERIVGVVHQDIPLRENRENRSARLDRRTATVRRVVELGEGQARELAHGPEVEEALRCVQIPRTRGTARGCFLELQLAQQQLPDRLRHLAGDLHPHGRAVGPAFRFFLDHLQQAHGAVLVELEVGAARHAERVRLFDESSRVDQAQVRADDVLHRDEAAPVRERQKAGERLRHLQVGKVHWSARRVAHHDGEGEAQVGNEWEGVPRRAGHGLRRDQGKHFLREGAAQDLLLSRRHVRPPQDPDAMRGEGREAHVPETASLPLEQSPHPDRDGMELLLHRPTACCRAFQCADAHHEKLVQVRAQDGEKSDPGKERDTRILRQLQYPAIELDQAQVAVQEVLWPGAVDVENGGA